MRSRRWCNSTKTHKTKSDIFRCSSRRKMLRFRITFSLKQKEKMQILQNLERSLYKA